MTRTLQRSLLTWLAVLAALGAMRRPSTDTLLFAVAFVLGTVLLRVRAWMLERGPSTPHRGRVLGEVVAVSFAGGLTAARTIAPSSPYFPAHLDAVTLAVAGVVPAIGLLYAASTAIRAWARARD